MGIVWLFILFWFVMILDDNGGDFMFDFVEDENVGYDDVIEIIDDDVEVKDEMNMFFEVVE